MNIPEWDVSFLKIIATHRRKHIHESSSWLSQKKSASFWEKSCYSNIDGVYSAYFIIKKTKKIKQKNL